MKDLCLTRVGVKAFVHLLFGIPEGAMVGGKLAIHLLGDSEGHQKLGDCHPCQEVPYSDYNRISMMMPTP